jgi:predicted transglutaminase-like cysteine proteinase
MRFLARLCFPAVAALALAGFKPGDLPVFPSKKWERISAHLETGIEQRMKSMEEVHAFVNSIPYMSDEENYGLPGYWAPPKEFFARRAGDCEDYVIAKYALGLENNLFSKEEALLVKALDLKRGGVAHMLLIVRGTVYDNQSGKPFALSSAAATRYRLLGIVKTG